MTGRRAAALLAAALLLAAKPAPAPRQHEVRPGETLSHIAQAFFGDPGLWPAIYLANRDRIKDPSRIYPGQKLAIPAVDEAMRKAARREAGALGPR